VTNILDVLAEYAPLIGAASTAAIAVLTVFLWFENRTLRRAGSSPEVVAYIKPHTDGSGAIEFVMANVGKGPAFGIEYNFICDESDFEYHRVMIRNDSDRMPISVLPQDEAMKSLFGISFELYGDVGSKNIGPLKPFKVLISYADISGRRFKRERAIDIRQFEGLRGVLAKSNERRIASAIEKIEKHLSVISQQSQQSQRFSAFVDTTELRDKFIKKTRGGE